ncbi:MAG TPA: hypothetical protein VI434_12440 [Candidatus Dormibacteraeota bacterium]
MTATLRMIRDATLMELHRGTFHVLLDGKDIGSIEWHETIEMQIEPGHHTLQVKAGRYTSGKSTVDAAEGDVVSFRCNGARIWPIYLASIVKPDLALTLSRR